MGAPQSGRGSSQCATHDGRAIRTSPPGVAMGLPCRTGAVRRASGRRRARARGRTRRGRLHGLCILRPGACPGGRCDSRGTVEVAPGRRFPGVLGHPSSATLRARPAPRPSRLRLLIPMQAGSRGHPRASCACSFTWRWAMKPKQLSLFAAAPWLVAAAMAAAAPAEEASGVIEEVIVLGDRVEETIPLDLQQFGNRVEVITADDLRLGGFNDVAQSLQMRVPGLYLAPKNGAFDYVGCSLQGSRCQDILWLIDGVRINNRLYNSTSPLDTVPAHMVERIEVLYGGQGIFYGTQSVAGVVNVVTKPFSDTQEGRVGLAVDGNDGVHASLDYRGSAGGHQFVVYASSDEADGIRPYRSEDIQPSTTDRDRSYDITMLGLKYAYDIGERSRLSLHYQHTDAELDFARPYLNHDTFNARDEDIVTLKYDLQATDNIGLFVKAYSHTWDTDYTRIYNV
ncbi:MAG: TonB-dependent receptor plug domain-containing protein, partial [Gammaproteobacteria bacterium]|nr:TonB-dependent receptor plug domain-containing protein [Gammaproteobacteria bacterium]